MLIITESNNIVNINENTNFEVYLTPGHKRIELNLHSERITRTIYLTEHKEGRAEEFLKLLLQTISDNLLKNKDIIKMADILGKNKCDFCGKEIEKSADIAFADYQRMDMGDGYFHNNEIVRIERNFCSDNCLIEYWNKYYAGSSTWKIMFYDNFYNQEEVLKLLK